MRRRTSQPACASRACRSSGARPPRAASFRCSLWQHARYAPSHRRPLPMHQAGRSAPSRHRRLPMPLADRSAARCKLRRWHQLCSSSGSIALQRRLARSRATVIAICIVTTVSASDVSPFAPKRGCLVPNSMFVRPTDDACNLQFHISQNNPYINMYTQYTYLCAVIDRLCVMMMVVMVMALPLPPTLALHSSHSTTGQKSRPTCPSSAGKREGFHCPAASASRTSPSGPPPPLPAPPLPSD